MTSIKKMRFSSSRTEILQLLFIGFAIAFCWISIKGLIRNGIDLFPIIIFIIGFLFAFGLIYLSIKMYSLKISGKDFEFISIFGKKIKIDITDVNVYGMSTFCLVGIDPLKFMTFTKINIKTKGIEKEIFVLNPSTLSSYNDIQKLIMDIYKMDIETKSKIK